MILSLFSGCGALDLGFEHAGFKAGLAYEIRPYSVESWNHNRPDDRACHVANVVELTLERMDADFGSTFAPTGIIGGPPCQSFSKANSVKTKDDPRTRLVARFFSVCLALNVRNPVDFIMMENVQELCSPKYSRILIRQVRRLERSGFSVRYAVLDASDYGVPQFRKRLILVAYNQTKYPNLNWTPPKARTGKKLTVRSAIGGLKAPAIFTRDLRKGDIPVHVNHWCMAPKSRKFFDGSLKQGVRYGRSFKTLRWNAPSNAISFGNREVHVHPSGKRRLSVYEAMLLQGFPNEFVLSGNLSQQITQVSEAVPPPLAFAIATSIRDQLGESAAAQPIGKALIAAAA